MRLTILRDLPHSELEIFLDRLIVHPCAIDAPAYRRNADSMLIHFYTADSAWIRRFVSEWAAQIARIQAHLHEPPSDGAEVIYPIADVMAQAALRFAMLEGEASAPGTWLKDNAEAFAAYKKRIEEHGTFADPKPAKDEDPDASGE